MDIKLQGVMNGIEAAKIINKNYKSAIAFISAYNYEDEIYKMNLNNIIGYIEKPFSQERIEFIINKVKQMAIK